MLPRDAIRIVALGLVICSGAAMAQPGAFDAGEISVYGGVLGGLGAHPVVGGSLGTAFSRYSMFLIDTSYAPLGVYTLRYHPGILTAHSGLYDFNLSLHLRLPVKERWAPYAILGAALLFNTYRQQVVPASGTASFSGTSYPAFGFETGAGVRYYVSPTWGIRGEYRYTSSSENFGRVVTGVFYQFEEGFLFRLLRGSRHGHKPY